MHAGAFLATSFTLGRKDNLHKVLLWVHEHTVAGLVIFGLLYVWFTVMFLPPALLAACAGALYGLLKAIPVVWACAVVSSTMSAQGGRGLVHMCRSAQQSGPGNAACADAAAPCKCVRAVTIARDTSQARPRHCLQRPLQDCQQTRLYRNAQQHAPSCCCMHREPAPPLPFTHTHTGW